MRFPWQKQKAQLRFRKWRFPKIGEPKAPARRKSFRRFWRDFMKNRPTDLPRAQRRQIARDQWVRRGKERIDKEI